MTGIPTSADAHALTLRDVVDADLPFLRLLYASTRSDELTSLSWDEETKRTFLEFQFSAQQRHYQTAYAGADFQVILTHGTPAGRLSVARLETEFRLLDISLLPERRNRGIGTALLRNLSAEAARAAKPLTLHVQPANPALRLYLRLGFVKLAEHGPDWFMQRLPPLTPAR